MKKKNQKIKLPTSEISVAELSETYGGMEIPVLKLIKFWYEKFQDGDISPVIL